MARSILVLMCLAGPAFAESFERPVPQAQSATAEIWYALASLLFCLALYGVHRLVSRR